MRASLFARNNLQRMPLRYEVSDGTAVITLDRPEVLNAFNDELGHATLQAVEKAAGDEGVRCIVITGEGRAFSSGEDLGALADGYFQAEAGRTRDHLEGVQAFLGKRAPFFEGR